MLDDTLHDAVLARGIAPFEEDEKFPVLRDDVALELHQLDLKPVELVLVFLVRKVLREIRRR